MNIGKANARSRPNHAARKPSKPTRYVCDAILGKLARWLRLLGLKTDYFPAIKDDTLTRHAAKTGATLVTRDRRLAQKARDFCPVVLLQENRVEGQLVEFFKIRRRKIPASFSTKYCPVCGGVLSRVRKKDIQNQVWPRVYERQRVFWKCSGCRQVFWPGTHVKKINETLKTARRQMHRL